MRANLDIHALHQLFVEQPLATITPSSLPVHLLLTFLSGSL